MRGAAMTKKIHDRKATETLAAGKYADVEIDDPYERGSKIEARRQYRGDPLGRLHAHRQIDDAQYHAGREYQKDKDALSPGARAIDPTQEAVDGGRMPEAITDQQIAARKRIMKIEGELGRRLTRVLEEVLIGQKSIRRLTDTEAQGVLRLHGALFRVALNELAELYGFSNGESRNKNVAVPQITS